jgi:hypothetical protein
MMFSFAEINFSNLQFLQTPLSRFSALLEKAIATEVEAEAERIDQILRDDPDYPWAEDLRELNMDELGQVQDLGGAFLLVALNQNLETAMERCLEEIFQEWHGENAEQQQARAWDEEHKKKSIIGRVKRVIPDMEKLSGFDEVDELRHIVNAWKHVGLVSQDLAAKYPSRWEAYRPLDGLAEHYARLNGPVREFAREVGDRLRRKWETLYRADQEAGAALDGT